MNSNFMVSRKSLVLGLVVLSAGLSAFEAGAQTSADRGAPKTSSETGAAPQPTNGVSSSARATPRPTPVAVATPAPYIPPTSSYGSSMNEGAKAAKKQAMVGAGLNGAVAAMYFAGCKSTRYYNCVLGAMHTAQAVMMVQNAKAAGKTAAATDYKYDPQFGGPTASMNVDTNGDGIPDSVGPGGSDQELMKSEKELQLLAGKFGAYGVKLSKDGTSVTLPDGRTVPTSAFNSDAGMASLGMTPDQIADLNGLKGQIAAKMKDKMRVIAMDLEGGGGGGGGSGSRGGKGGAGGGYRGPNFGDMFGEKDKRKTASVKGLAKQLGNDKIGVPDDNIFEMISRQYQKEEGKQSFIQTQVPAAPGAAPAMVPASSAVRPGF